MDFLDLDIPKHGFPCSRDRTLRIAMKSLQNKGPGLPKRPLDPVKEIGNPSNKSQIRQTNPEIRQTNSRCRRDGAGPPGNNQIRLIIVKQIGKSVKQNNYFDFCRTDSCQRNSVKQILGFLHIFQKLLNKFAVKEIRQTNYWIRQTKSL